MTGTECNIVLIFRKKGGIPVAARETALGALIACRRQKAWSDGILKEYVHRDQLDRREAALASQLCYGVLQNRLLLDYYLGQLLRCRIRDLQPVVLDILRLGLYQILFLDKIPPSAAVNEAVEQGKRYANARAAGLINGVLRSAIRQGGQLQQPQDLALLYSHPQALVELLRQELGEQMLEQVLQADNQAPETVLQVNCLRASDEAVQQSLEEAGGICTPHPWLEHCFLVSGAGGLERLEAFRAGLFYVQDAASRLAVQCAGIQPGMRILDSCGAPGGKTFAAAMELGGQGMVLSCDLHLHKLTLIENGARRLGLDWIQTRQQDAKAVYPELRDSMDVVLVDVPCSGLGIIRKKPDIRYKDLEQIQELPALQGQILYQQAQYVKPGGVLLYSTCTILRRENQEVVRAFLQENPEFSPEPLPLPAALPQDSSGMLTLLPGQYETDGFFICKLRRHACGTT